jgi:hypothetical protein
VITSRLLSTILNDNNDSRVTNRFDKCVRRIIVNIQKDAYSRDGARTEA